MKQNWFFECIRLFGQSFKVGFQFIYGRYTLSRLPSPIISIFGGKGADLESAYAQQAYQFAAHCVAAGISVLTGGGPGLMEAANCGAYEKSKQEQLKQLRTLGVGVRGIDEDFINPCAPLVKVDYLFIRKWLLMRYSCAFVIFPGGIGTADEFFDLLNLMKLKRMKRVPVVLVGSSYWQPLVNWYEQSGMAQGFIKQEYRDLFSVVDDTNEAFSIVHNACKH